MMTWRRAVSFADPFVLIMLGVVLTACLLPATGRLMAIVEAVADVAIVALFFLHGAKLSPRAVVDGAKAWRLHIATLGMTFVLFPLGGLLVRQTGLLPSSLADGFLFLTLLPSTVQSSIAFTAMARGNVAAAVCAASFSNLIGIIATPLWVARLFGSESGADWRQAALAIILQLLLPFVAGNLSRPWIGAFVQRHKSALSIVDRSSILLVVYCAVAAAVAEGLWSRISVPVLVMVGLVSLATLAVVLGLSWMLGKMLGLPREDLIVLQFCGSKKSLASGVPMASVLFAPAQAGMVVLPLIVFHQVQLLVCAVMARRYGTAASASVVPVQSQTGS